MRKEEIGSNWWETEKASICPRNGRDILADRPELESKHVQRDRLSPPPAPPENGGGGVGGE